MNSLEAMILKRAGSLLVNEYEQLGAWCVNHKIRQQLGMGVM